MSDIFFCYRRNDNPQTAWHLAHMLNARHKTFLDTHIRGGEPWGDKLKNEIANCTVFVCFIGENWLEKNEKGLLRIKDETDVVRQELELAIELKKRILPILVGDVRPPKETDLPPSLKLIPSLEFVRLRYIPPHFYMDAGEVTRRISEIITEQKGYIYVAAGNFLRFTRRIFGVAATSAALSAFATYLIFFYKPPPPPVPIPEPSPASSDRYGQILARKEISATPEVNIGYRVSSMPLSYEDAKGDKLGFMQDVCDIISNSLFPDFRIVRWEVFSNPDVKPGRDRFEALENGRIDLECGSTSITGERMQRANFLPVQIYSQTAVLHPRTISVHDKNGNLTFSGRRVNYVQGTTNAAILSASGTAVADIGEMYNNLKANKAELIFLDDVLLAGFLASYGSKARDYTITRFGDPEQYGIMIPRDSPTLDGKVREVWAKLKAEGKVCQLYNKYFKAPAMARQLDLIETSPTARDSKIPGDDLGGACGPKPK